MVANMTQSRSVLDDVITLTRKMRTVFDALARERGLSLARARILIRLSTSDGFGQSQKALAEELDIEAPTLVGLLDGLEQSGTIRRVAVQGDRRARRIELTEEGREPADGVNAMVGDFRENVLRGIGEKDLDVLRTVVTRMQSNLEGIA